MSNEKCESVSALYAAPGLQAAMLIAYELGDKLEPMAALEEYCGIRGFNTVAYSWKFGRFLNETKPVAGVDFADLFASCAKNVKRCHLRLRDMLDEDLDNLPDARAEVDEFIQAMKSGKA